MAGGFDATRLSKLEREAMEAVLADDINRATALLDQLAAATPDHPIVLLGRARMLVLQDDDRAALAIARRAVAALPDVPMAWHVLATAASHAENMQLAQQAYEKCLDLTDRQPRVLVEFAHFMAANRAPKVAEVVINEAIERSPGDPDAWMALATWRLRQNQRTEAKTALQRALELDPNHTHAKLHLSWLLGDEGAAQKSQALLSLAEDDRNASEDIAALQKYQRSRDAVQRVYEKPEVQKELFGSRHHSPAALLGLAIVTLLVCGYVLFVVWMFSRSIIHGAIAILLGLAVVSWRMMND